jgi:DNA repair protein RecN (Recombination protein N)
MLTRLKITDFAIIDQLDFEPGPGLVVLTGETGAGKSIILDAIQTILGGPVDQSMIRAGASKARLEAWFEINSPQPELAEILANQELLDEPGQLMIEREIRLEGRSTVRVNGHAVSQSIVREIGSYLVDIHGQSEYLSLLNTKSHLHLLDRFARNEDTLALYQDNFHQLQKIRREIREIQKLEQETTSRLELMNFQLNEIQTAHLVPGEDEHLDQERSRLANAENLAAAAQEILTLLDESTQDVPSISDQLGQARHAMHTLSRIDSSLADTAEQFESLLIEVAELARDVRQYADQIENNPRRLAEVEERLALLQNLKRKYGGSIQSALDFAEKTSENLEKIASSGDRLEKLLKEEAQLRISLGHQAEQLSKLRKEAATTLSQMVETQLTDLKMDGARFQVDFQHPADPAGIPISSGQSLAFDQRGIDQVEFLIAPNPGEGLKPLVKIASGGETSRLMLALKHVLAKEDPIPTLVFDEIDQGIGGRVGSVVGKKLWQLSSSHQVFCVTHLPQLAAFGVAHYRVSKQTSTDRTSTHVERLARASRVEELALMLGSLSEISRLSAEELLRTVEEQHDLAKVDLSDE